MARIISASRRTDIPRFYGRWFAERRKAGVAEFRNAFGFKGSVSLEAEDVLGYLFWTKHAAPFALQLRELTEQGVPWAIQYTVNGYGEPLEPHIPPAEQVVEDFRKVRELLPSSRCAQWRYDPIVLSGSQSIDVHRERFSRLASALEGVAEVVNISFVEPYLKVLRRIEDRTIRYRKLDPARHKAASKRFPDLPFVGDEVRTFLDELASVASRHGMELRACANPEWGIPPSQCCGAEMFAPYGSGLEVRLGELKRAPTREACRCLQSVDIGMDNTCVGGCLYCYVVSSQEIASRHFEDHEPSSSSIR